MVDDPRLADDPRILLFDIDGTLVSTGGAGAEAWKRAFQDLHGIPADIGQFTDAGMTDPDVGARTFEAVMHRPPTSHDSRKCSSAGLNTSPRPSPKARATESCPRYRSAFGN